MADGGQVDDRAESALTVVIAGAANLLIGVAKAVGGVLSGSTSMFAEAAHSVADTLTEILLYVSVRRGAKPADREHPLGYGRETFLWAFIASLATFFAGAGYSITEGVRSLLASGEHSGRSDVAYAILGVAFCIESLSLWRAAKQVRETAERYDVGARWLLRRTSDTAVKAVVFEDSAALVGLVLAAAGLGLRQLTGQEFWDGAASIAIGLLLVVVAASLARTNASLLTGRSAPPALEAALREVVAAVDGIDSLPVFVTVMIGPGEMLVAAKVDFDDDVTAERVEQIADDAERLLRERFSGVRYVFLDPTPGDSRAGIMEG